MPQLETREVSLDRIPKQVFDEIHCVYRLKRKDTRALEDLIEEYEYILKRVGYLQLGDLHLAEDVVQATFIAAWNSVGSLRDESRLRPWLFGILFNQCRNQIRSLVRKRKREQLAHEMREGQADGETEAMERHEKLTHLQKCMLELKPGQRELIILKYEQGLPLSEIALILKVSLGTVKSRLHRSVEALRQKVELSHEP